MSGIHIASCVAYARPGQAEAVVRRIGEAGIGEVPRQDASGRLVVLIEGESPAEVLAAIDALHALEGVAAVHLAYQHAEPDENEKEKPR